MVTQHDQGQYADDLAVHAAVKEAQRAPLIRRSLEYGIVTPWTSFIAIEERIQGEAKLQQPSLASILESVAVDDMPYLAWPQPLRAMERLSAALASHREAYQNAIMNKESGDELSRCMCALQAGEAGEGWMQMLGALINGSGSMSELVRASRFDVDSTD
jgi:poly [ADP-ribose] polymerase